MKIIGVIPARYGSSRFPGKPLADICGKPMIWWTYQQVIKVPELESVYVATEDERVLEVCKKYDIQCIMTRNDHNTPTSRVHEVSQKIDADAYVFVGGDEPLIQSKNISKVINGSDLENLYVTSAMTTIKNSSEVIDYTNIKVVTNTNNDCVYTTRSPIPYPKGGLMFDYKKLVTILMFSKEALEFFDNTVKSQLEIIEECDFIRFIENGKTMKMVDVEVTNLSVDTPKDLEVVRYTISNMIANNELNEK